MSVCVKKVSILLEAISIWQRAKGQREVYTSLQVSSCLATRLSAILLLRDPVLIPLMLVPGWEDGRDQNRQGICLSIDQVIYLVLFAKLCKAKIPYRKKIHILPIPWFNKASRERYCLSLSKLFFRVLSPFSVLLPLLYNGAKVIFMTVGHCVNE